MLFGSAFFAIPGIGPVLVLGPMVAWIVGALEGAAVFGGLSAIGAGLYSMGIPRDSILQYEMALKTDNLLMVHGSASEVEKARDIIASTRPVNVTLHAAEVADSCRKIASINRFRKVRTKKMLTNTSLLKGLAIRATDGDLGTVDQFYFDDETWAIRYLTVETGGWLGGRQVLISPFSVVEADWQAKRLDVALTKKQVEHSPSSTRISRSPAARGRIPRVLRVSVLLGRPLSVGPAFYRWA